MGLMCMGWMLKWWHNMLHMPAGICRGAAALVGLCCAGTASKDPMQVAVLNHPKVVNSAYFSPISGSKILTTCIDNRCCSNMNALSDCLLRARLPGFMSSFPA